ncbi:MAG: topoisomerase DNA-binding C4 zinc finger domain-containing protein [Alphaproteobacteria bacterium]|nr:topoisomerase DNA-binding C4 zinc finger domain-containing protein [Alphaproteobacteria bacterium]
MEDVQIIKQRLQSSDVSRIVSRRQHIQSMFYGCSNYPKCKFTVSC